MVYTTIDIADELERELREYTHRRGDLKRIVNEALEDWLAKQKVKDVP